MRESKKKLTYALREAYATERQHTHMVHQSHGRILVADHFVLQTRGKRRRHSLAPMHALLVVWSSGSGEVEMWSALPLRVYTAHKQQGGVTSADIANTNKDGDAAAQNVVPEKLMHINEREKPMIDLSFALDQLIRQCVQVVSRRGSYKLQWKRNA